MAMISFELDDERVKRLDEVAQKQERTRSYILREAVKKYLEETT